MVQMMTGGCQCGRVRYVARVEGDAGFLCHCSMCRRATGATAAAFCNLKKSDVRWTTQAPEQYRSSPIASRGFCAACGTPLSFEFPGGKNMDLTIGSFDDPGFFRPTHHFSIETRLAGWVDTVHLPGYRLDQHAPTVERWMKTVGRLPD